MKAAETKFVQLLRAYNVDEIDGWSTEIMCIFEYVKFGTSNKENKIMLDVIARYYLILLFGCQVLQ